MLRLTLERQARGLSQTELAFRARIHPATLSRIEAGKTFVYPGWRKRLAAALGWPVERADELFQGVEVREPAGRR